MAGTRIAILGCGYVGLELGRQLRDTATVFGVRRSQAGLAAIADAGFEPVEADLTDPGDLRSIPDVDVLVYSASGGRGIEGARRIYNTGLSTVIEHFDDRETAPGRLLYTSSTGVYGDHDGEWVDETTPIEPETERQRVLLEAERLVLDTAAARGIDGTVVRFGGLYGPDRYRLERYLEGPVTGGYLNLLHRADAAGVLRFLIEGESGRNDVVVAVDEEPVEKWTLADWLATQLDLPAPPKQTIEERLADADLEAGAEHRIRAQKRCSSRKLRDMGYSFVYPTFREGYRDAIEAYSTDADESR